MELALSALEDLEQLVRYHAQQGSPETGRRLAREILAKIQRLARYPDSGRQVPEFGVPFIREIIFPPFRIVYRREQKRVGVARVWRSERPLGRREVE